MDTARSTTQHSTAQHSIAQDSTGYHTQYTQHSTEVNAQPSERVNQLEVSQDRSRSVRVHAGVVTACASRAWNRVPSPRTSQACRHGVAQGKCSGRGEGTHCVRVYAYACVRAPRVCACVRAPCVGACVTGRGGAAQDEGSGGHPVAPRALAQGANMMGALRHLRHVRAHAPRPIATSPSLSDGSSAVDVFN